MKQIYYVSSFLLLLLLTACNKIEGEKSIALKTIEIPENLKERFKGATESVITDTLTVEDSYVQIKAVIVEKSEFKFIKEVQINQVRSNDFEITGNLGYKSNKEGDKQLVSGQVLFYREKLGSKYSRVKYFTISSEGKIVKAD